MEMMRWSVYDKRSIISHESPQPILDSWSLLMFSLFIGVLVEIVSELKSSAIKITSTIGEKSFWI